MELTGRSLGHYRVEEEISRGGMGVVYRATDTRLNRDVALKVLPQEVTNDDDVRRRFLKEAQAASALEHPHIAVIHGADEVDGIAYIALSPRAAGVATPTAHLQVWSAIGQALLETGRPAEALPWFEKVATSGYERVRQPIVFVRSFYFLGRIYEQQGDKVKSQEAYRRFVGYWKDGDLDRDRIAEAQRKIGS